MLTLIDENGKPYAILHDNGDFEFLDKKREKEEEEREEEEEKDA